MTFRRTIRIADRSYEIASDDDYLRRMGARFEPSLVALMEQFVDATTVAADVGANLGLTTIFLASRCSRTIGFEPSPSTFAFLKHNVDRSGVGGCTVENLGLGSLAHETEITFAATDRSGGFVSDLLRPSAGHTSERIRIETLDGIWNRHADDLHFMKIDVEGYEQDVLEGGRVVIARFKPTIVLELNHWCLNAFRRRSVPDFFDFLRAIFPYLYAVDHDNRTVRDLHNNDQAYEVLHEHIVKFRFPNLVAGFDDAIPGKLTSLSR